jgi:hypothetical protein
MRFSIVSRWHCHCQQQYQHSPTGQVGTALEFHNVGTSEIFPPPRHFVRGQTLFGAQILYHSSQIRDIVQQKYSTFIHQVAQLL